MLIYIKIAVRNVHKNLRSMLFNGVGIVLTVMMLVFIFAFSRGIEMQIVERNIRFETGGVIVRLEKELTGWENQADGDSLLHQIESTLQASPHVEGYRKRITTRNASLYANEATQRVTVEGVDSLELELLNQMVAVVEGDTDWEIIGNGLLISKELAEETVLTVGSECFIVLPTADGSVNMQEYIVTGIFRNTSYNDKYQTYMPYDKAKELYHVNLPTRMLIDLDRFESADTVAALLDDAAQSESVEVKTYKEFMGRAKALSGINRSALLGMAFFLLFISFVGIWAMISEQVNERRKEMGTLLTFGFSISSVKRIFLFESVYISILFMSIGLFLILIILTFIRLNEGVYLGNLAAFAFGSSTVLPELRWNDIGVTMAIGLLYPLVATWLALQSMNWKSIVKLMNGFTI